MPSLEHLTANEKQALSDFTTAVRSGLGAAVLQMLLFGSKARGDGDEESDIDVLLLVDQRTREVKQIVGDAAFDASLANDVVLSPIVSEKEGYDCPLHRATAFYANVQREGIPL